MVFYVFTSPCIGNGMVHYGDWQTAVYGLRTVRNPIFAHRLLNNSLGILGDIMPIIMIIGAVGVILAMKSNNDNCKNIQQTK